MELKQNTTEIVNPYIWTTVITLCSADGCLQLELHNILSDQIALFNNHQASKQ